MSVSSVAPLPRRTTLKADETRELILGAAELRFAATGFYPTRLEDIAEDVGITRTAVIYHFQDKETLYNAVLERLFAQLNDRISAALDSSLDLPARVEAAVEAWLDFAGARPTLMRLFMREVAGSEGGLRPEVQQFVDPMFARLIGTLDEGRRSNAFRAIDPVQFWSILAGASMFFIMDAPLLANSETVARLDTYKQELKRVARHMLGTGEMA
ncbi:MAG TPA: TetR/AcrR family transcriptional regulator [Pseudomonadales bacterium]|nr:TetR/AcrR family transcriptional regulator [Pseudomonadales bacterium]HNN87386.1 TetR/AcrR family transcriptional regulator [Pseudomonadales bacterium]